MKKVVVLVLLFVLAAACGRKDSFIPDRLLTEQEMVDIMADVQIIEADINYQKSQEREHKDSIPAKPVDYVKVSKLYYDQLFEHHGITDSIFIQNIRYYSERPAVLETIMDSVTQRLTKEQSESQRDDSQ